MQEYIELTQSSRLAAIGAALAGMGTALAILFFFLAARAIFRKAALALRCGRRALRLARERARNFPNEKTSALRYEMADARRMFTIESAAMGSFWKRAIQGLMALTLVVAGAACCGVAWGLRDAVAYESSAELGVFNVEEGSLVWDEGGGKSQRLFLLPGETFVVFEGEELICPSWARHAGLVRHHRVIAAHFYLSGDSPWNPGAPSRSLDLASESPFFARARSEPWKSRFSLEFTRVVSPAVDFARGPHVLRILDSGYAFTPLGETRGSVSQEEGEE